MATNYQNWGVVVESKDSRYKCVETVSVNEQDWKSVVDIVVSCVKENMPNDQDLACYLGHNISLKYMGFITGKEGLDLGTTLQVHYMLNTWKSTISPDDDPRKSLISILKKKQKHRNCDELIDMLKKGSCVMKTGCGLDYNCQRTEKPNNYKFTRPRGYYNEHKRRFLVNVLPNSGAFNISFSSAKKAKGKRSIDDIYHMGEILGEGSFGAVFSATKTSTGKTYALKRIPLPFDDKGAASHRREAEVMSRLNHDNIVAFYPPLLQFKEGPQEYLYMAMELCQKKTLSSYIRQYNAENKILQKRPELLSWYEDLCSAIKYIHGKRLIHRDVKPSNIYFSQKEVLKLGDFGLACDIYTESKTSGTNVGTRLYASPEQRNEKRYDQKTDIYPLGLILYEMLHPQHGDVETSLLNVRERRFPQNFVCKKREKELISKILSPEPNERPDIDEIISEIKLIPRDDSTGKFQNTMDTKVNPLTMELPKDMKDIECQLNQKLTGEQIAFLNKHVLQDGNGKNLEKDVFGSLPKTDSILRSVCMIHWEEYDTRSRRNNKHTGTGFLAEVPNNGIAFLSAGHNFMDILNKDSDYDSLDRYIIQFGNVSGEFPTTTHSPPEHRKPMRLKEFLDTFKVSGSIRCAGHAALFKDGELVQYHRYTSSSETLEDYCVLILNHDDVKGILKEQGLDYLICGRKPYLEHNPGGLVAIFGHAISDYSREPEKLPLTMSFGVEKNMDEIENYEEKMPNVTELTKKTPFLKLLNLNPERKGKDVPLHELREEAKNYLFYSNDTVPGNSGSPVIGRGDPKHKQGYVVKGIHTDLFNSQIINGAQTIFKIKEWINWGKHYLQGSK